MKRRILRVDDPDKFLERCEFEFDAEAEECPHIKMELKEGELPPRFPRFYYEEIDEC